MYRGLPWVNCFFLALDTSMLVSATLKSHPRGRAIAQRGLAFQWNIGFTLLPVNHSETIMLKSV